MAVVQIKTSWQGGPSSPGLTVMNLEDVGTPNYAAALAAVRAWWDSLKAQIPDEYTLTVEPLVEFYDPVTGQLSGEYAAGVADTPAPVLGTNVGGYMHGVGTRVDWTTSYIRNGRRVRGRTYIVPWSASSFTTDGILATTSVSLLGTSAQTLIDSLEAAGLPLAVWSRPSTTSPVGALAPVIGVQVPTKVAILRGRRD